MRKLLSPLGLPDRYAANTIDTTGHPDDAPPAPAQPDLDLSQTSASAHLFARPESQTSASDPGQSPCTHVRGS